MNDKISLKILEIIADFFSCSINFWLVESLRISAYFGALILIFFLPAFLSSFACWILANLSCLIFSFSFSIFSFSSSVFSFGFVNLLMVITLFADFFNFANFLLLFFNSSNFFFLVPSKYCFNSFISLIVKSERSTLINSCSIKFSIGVLIWLLPLIISCSYIYFCFSEILS